MTNSTKKLAAFLITLLTLLPVAALADDPVAVGIPGDYQDEVGCPGDWQPDCPDTQLTFDAEDDIWQGTFALPLGMWSYKAALNSSWDENYGAGGVPGGANILLDLAAAGDVKFYYDHKTHWVTDTVNSRIVTAPGDYQDELGCAGDWQPGCLRSWLQDGDGDGVFTFTTAKLPAGAYQVKAAIGESWDENYGAGGVPGGANIPFNVALDCASTVFTFDSPTNVLTVAAGSSGVVQPAAVTVAGNLQDELGCPGDWQPDCAATHLTFDAADQVWQGTWNVPAGNWEYKAPINDSWDENYGANATRNGANIPLSLAAAQDVKFFFSRDTNWITDNVNSVVATLPGSFQSELGCPGDWDPSCLRSWLQDPDGDGVYTFSTASLPAGNYEVKVAINESWDENYGDGGVQNGPNIGFTVPQPCTEIFFTYDPASHVLTVGTEAGGPAGNLDLAKAHWVSESLLAWNSSPAQVASTIELAYALAGGMTLGADGLAGADGALVLTPAGALPGEVTEKFPHLSGYPAYQIDGADLGRVPAILEDQLALVAKDLEGKVIDATSLQIPGVLDDLYAYDGPLGISWLGALPTLRVWAPTAQQVTLHLFDDADPSTAATPYAMTRDENGVWSVTGDASWKWRYYLYEVVVFVPSTGAVETNLVTDPYSVSLSADSARSQIVDLKDPALKPPGWAGVLKPKLAAPENSVLYELHVRDFSWYDETVSEEARGRFLAFTEKQSNGMRHLARLAKAGLTHVHLLPSFDIATVAERREDQVEVDPDLLASYGPDSTEQQALIEANADADGFNWGYDPWHYTVPEGSYATDPDGGARVKEFRSMVKSLNETGLRVVMDVVYNHTNAAGQNSKSVLDRLVPGYYHRLSLDGAIEQSSCCPNTASEHFMMEKLMIDSVLTWAKDYKVDGFRFDLMGHHMLANLLKLRAALDALTFAHDGVDGSQVILYGEGWNFGEVADGARGTNAIQRNMAGTGIGTFNDRIRDAVRGGGPFDGGEQRKRQGFVTGLYVDPNGLDQGTMAEQKARLLLLMDQVRVSLAGNLKDFVFEDRFGNVVTGAGVDYNGQPAGYTLDPQESIHYAAAHDNETFFDAVQYKVPLSTSAADRVRVQNLGLDVIGLAQGIPFFHAGQDMLRSKSLDRDSYNSGDWFNRLDFSYQTNNWGVGLPAASKNGDDWFVQQPLLADPSLAVSSDEIEAAAEHFREVLQIRKSSRLFRLRTGDEIQARLAFHNTGPAQVPGVIVLSIDNPDHLPWGCYRRVVVVINATPQTQAMEVPELAGASMHLHPVQASSEDPVVRGSSFGAGTFTVPPRTTAVFVEDF